MLYTIKITVLYPIFTNFVNIAIKNNFENIKEKNE